MVGTLRNKTDILTVCYRCDEELFVYWINDKVRVEQAKAIFASHVKKCSGSSGHPCTHCAVHQPTASLASHESTCAGKRTSKDESVWDFCDLGATTLHADSVRYLKKHVYLDFPCPWKDKDGTPCEIQYTNQGNVNIHLEYIHRKKGLCKQCGKVLSSALALRGHMMLHTGEKDACDWEGCEVTGTPGNLRNHMWQHTQIFYNAPSQGSYFRESAFIIDGSIRNSPLEDAVMNKWLQTPSGSDRSNPLNGTVASTGDDSRGCLDWNQQMIRKST